MKALSETDSGKLVSVVSADLSQIERALGFAPMIIGAPAVFAICLAVIGVVYGQRVCLIMFIAVVLSIGGQYLAGSFVGGLYYKFATLTDERLKLVTEMVAGLRTIKCYGWEFHYLKKINAVRAKQTPLVIKINWLSNLG